MALQRDALVLILSTQPILSPLSCQDTKFAQQDRFITRRKTILHQTTRPPFREASESIDGVSSCCFSVREGGG